MLNKKQKDEANPSDKLEQKVDSMMDPRASEQTPSSNDSTDTPPPINIFEGVTTAPELPGAKPVKESLQAPNPTDNEVKPSAAVTSAVSGSEESPAVQDGKDPLEDPETDAAVDSIVREDSDKLLAVEDAEKQPPISPKREGFKTKIKRFFSAWWHNKKARYATLAAIFLLILAASAWPTSRYFLLNTAGVRSSASLTVIDESTGLPLKNVAVTLGDLSAKTDKDGKADFKSIKLGSQELLIDRVAFAPIEKKITIGWGSNPLGTFDLSAVGAQYVFNATDYLSGKPVGKLEATSGQASAFADKKGKVVLTVDKPESDELTVHLKADGYRTEKLVFPAATKEAFEVRMVPGQPNVYVTKQSGKYDVYKVDVDGKNKQLLLAGTGSERQNIGLVVSADGSHAALVSSRSKIRDSGGYLLDTLTLINVKDGQTKEIDQAQNFQLVDWSGKRLVYRVTYAAASAANAQRQRIIAYDVEKSARSVLITSDYFNSVSSTGGYVYYAIANSDPGQQPSFGRIKADGSGKQTILGKQVWTVVRSDAETMNLETPEGWYTYMIGESTTKKGNPPADTYASRLYVDGPSNGKSLWIDSRDGKGVLLAYDQKAKKDREIVSAGGLTIPMRWLSPNTVAYRIHTNSEIAEYVKNIDGGEPKKISNVTATYGYSARN